MTVDELLEMISNQKQILFEEMASNFNMDTPFSVEQEYKHRYQSLQLTENIIKRLISGEKLFTDIEM